LSLLTGQEVNGGSGFKKGDMLTEENLSALSFNQWFDLPTTDEAVADQLERVQAYLKERQIEIDAKFEDKKRKITYR
jgi:DNA-directed RNA polymerase subunit beta